MIRSATQLKAKVRNLSGGDSNKAQMLIRNFFMERLLERIAISEYRDHFILKGGMLVASIAGIEHRATMDMDTTIEAKSLSRDEATAMIKDIICVDVPDGVAFTITRITDIMEDQDYPGIRFLMEATLDKMRQGIKLDLSTGDVITPGAIEYSYRLMLEDRDISIRTYNLETLLGEKLETIMARGILNTRMRDFYDIYILSQRSDIDYRLLGEAFIATSNKRGTASLIINIDRLLENIVTEPDMRGMWNKYSRDNFFVGDLSWEEVNESVRALMEKAIAKTGQMDALENLINDLNPAKERADQEGWISEGEMGTMLNDIERDNSP